MTLSDIWMPQATPPSTVEVYSPQTGLPLHELVQCSAADVDAAVAAARTGAVDWSQRSFAERRRILLRGHDLVLARSSELIETVVGETGKTHGQALEEVVISASSTRYNARAAARVLRSRRRAPGLPGITRTAVRYAPKGVVGVVTPWNYPLSLAALDVIPALAAGNTVVQKADNQGATSVLALRRAFIDAGLPEHAWIVVTGPADQVGERLTDLVDYICFTGSTAVGSRVAEKAGRRLVGASLELGGKNALIVLDDVDPTRAAEDTLYAAFASMGQLCVSIERIYVLRSVADAYLRALGDVLGRTPVGTGENDDFGSLTTAAQLERVQAHLDDALAHGATIVGRSESPRGASPHGFSPTVLRGVTDQMRCYREESFGALAWVQVVDSIDAAVEAANDSSYGLNAAVFSGSVRRARAVASRLSAGAVNINEGFRATFSAVAAPMGGVKQSGIGRRNGPEGLLRFVEPITVAWTTGLLRLPRTASDFDRLGPLMLWAMRALKALGVR